MRVAVIDLGTNTFNLLISDFSRDGYTITETCKLPVNLGRGGINQGLITPEAMERGYNALLQYREKITLSGAEKVYAFATSAVRSAGNGKEFVREVKERTGFEIKVIDGNEEAALIYQGVLLSGALEEELSVIMDIGGGSTEFIIGNSKSIKWKQSFELGAARLLERFGLSDPVDQAEIFAIEEYLAEQLGPLDTAMKDLCPALLIGSSGSFDTLAEMIAHRFYTPEILEGRNAWEFKLDDYYTIHELIVRSTKQERLRTKGMVEMRVDMIVVATMMIFYFIRKYGIRRMKFSTYALKEGVLKTIMQDLYS